MVKYFNFHNFSFALRYFFNVNGKAIYYDTPLVLFFFVLSCWDLPNHGRRRLVSLESSWWVRRGAPTCWFENECLELLWWWCRSYLIIEPFSQWKLNKMKIDN
jgi:hypothetical protein